MQIKNPETFSKNHCLDYLLRKRKAIIHRDIDELNQIVSSNVFLNRITSSPVFFDEERLVFGNNLSFNAQTQNGVYLDFYRFLVEVQDGNLFASASDQVFSDLQRVVFSPRKFAEFAINCVKNIPFHSVPDEQLADLGKALFNYTSLGIGLANIWSNDDRYSVEAIDTFINPALPIDIFDSREYRKKNANIFCEYIGELTEWELTLCYPLFMETSINTINYGFIPPRAIPEEISAVCPKLQAVHKRYLDEIERELDGLDF